MPIQKIPKYLKSHINSKSINSQSLPIIEIDSLLISWGLLRGKYHNNNTIEVKKKYIYYQWFLIVLNIFTLPKHIIAIILSDNSNEIYKYGDVGWFYGNRKVMNSIWLIGGINSLSLLLLFMTRIGELSWLRIMQLCKKQLSPEEIGLDHVMGNEFWKRVFFFTFVTKVACSLTFIGTLLIAIAFFIFIVGENQLL